MSGTSLTSSDLLSATEKAAKANSIATANTTGGSSSSASATASAALTSLAGNFNSFLTLLTTQLQNQDPSSPMDSSQFTSQIATFAGVQQQVDTNTNLGQLISLTQNGQATGDAGLVGQTATFSGSQISLQSGTGNIAFTTTSAEPIAIAISDASGQIVRTVQDTSKAGSNSWTWNGQDDAGKTLPDGTYGIAVQTQDSGGNVTAVPFTTSGTISGVQKAANGDVLLQIGNGTVDMNNVTSVSKGA